MKIETKDLEYENQSFHLNVDSIIIEEGGITGIGGPNGSGKSTLLKLLYGYLKPLKGAVLIDGKELIRMKSQIVANAISVVQQETPTPMNFTVENIVSMSRYNSPPDKERIEESLSLCGILDLRYRRFEELSGGEHRLVMIAGALYQGTDIIMLDEPTTFLDVDKELRIVDLMTNLKKAGKTLVVVIHDINILGKLCNRVVMMKNGRVEGQGYPSLVFTSELLTRVFGSNFLSFSTPDGVMWKPYNRPRVPDTNVLVIEEEYSPYGLAYNVWKTGLSVRRIQMDGGSRNSAAVEDEILGLSSNTNFILITKRSLDILGKEQGNLVTKLVSKGKVLLLVDYENESKNVTVDNGNAFLKVFGIEKTISDICQEVYETCMSLSSPSEEKD